MILSRDSDECLKCPHHDYCDEKRMVACALKEVDLSVFVPYAAPAMPMNTTLIMAPILRDTSVSAQIREQIRKDFEKEFYKSCGISYRYLEKGDA